MDNKTSEFIEILEAESARYIATCDMRLQMLEAKYNADQPRVPAGSSDGGQWTGGGSVTVHSPTEISTHHPDGSTETRIGGSRAWRNKNPSNIRSGSFANRHGAIGDNHGFAIFPDEETGHAASRALLKTPSYSRLTVDEAIARRSPASENDTGRTQHLVRIFSGLTGKEKIQDLDERQLDKLTSAIGRAEGWQPGKIVRTKTPQ